MNILYIILYCDSTTGVLLLTLSINMVLCFSFHMCISNDLFVNLANLSN